MKADYKFSSHPQPLHRRRVRNRVLLAASFLAATLFAVRYLDPAAFMPEATAVVAPPSVSRTLVLPQPDMKTGASEMAGDRLPPPDGTAPEESPLQSEGDPVPTTVAAEPSLSQEPEIAAVEDESGPETTAFTEAPAPTEPTLNRIEYMIAQGDSLARIFSKHGFDAGLLHRIVNSTSETKALANIRPGQTLRFLVDDNRELVRLELQRSPVDSLRVRIADDEISAEEVSRDVERRTASASGVIESSLFADGQKAGLSDGQIMELATIFGWDIDFALEIRAGDQFRVLFEEHYVDGEKLRDGPILAAEFTNRGTTYRAVRYEDNSGEIGYFDADGQSKRRAFIRSPIKFARVSSRFNPRRWHPILKKWRSHKGVDYAAPTGTPVRATGDGRVVFRGTKNGYGKTVILEHAGKYTTLYAHLSRYSNRAASGTRVKQGQVIGYVGATGLASGPHLHYEFRVGGAHRDPLNVKLPKSLALAAAEITRFRSFADPLLAQLEAIPAETMVASAPSESPSTP